MVQTRKGKTKWQKVRRLFNDIHLWLGLTSGLFVLVICFSGTVYVFNTEITEMGAPHLYKVQPVPGMDRLPADAFIEKIEQVSGGKIASVNISADPERTYQFNVKKKEDKSRFGTAYMIDPYTGVIAGNSLEKNSAKEFMSIMFSLHRWLLLDKIETSIFSGMTNRELGSKISGWATILFTLGCITGLVIWFPQKLRTWRKGLKIKMSGNWKRINHDLHNSLAFYSLFFLLLMGLTGPQWSFDWYRNGLQKTLGTYQPKDTPAERKGGEPEKKITGKKDKKKTTATSQAQVKDENEKQRLSIAAFMKEADKQLPYSGNYVITFPPDSESAILVGKTRKGFFAPAAGDRLLMDQYTGAMLKTDLFRNKPFNERIAGSIKAIHIGNVYGTFTKILYFLACLIATSLPVTGTLIWFNKLKKKKKPFNAVPEKISAQAVRLTNA